MRIVGGSLARRRIKAPSGDATRPTADRVRESLFSILGTPPNDAAVLDLFAGAGTLGLEALSRGAASAVFVDRAPAAIRCVRDNLEALDLASRAEVVARPVAAALAALVKNGRSFHWIFLDPPYKLGALEPTLELLGAGPLVADGAVVVAEHDRRGAPADAFGCLVRTDRRRYGDTELTFYQRGEP